MPALSLFPALSPPWLMKKYKSQAKLAEHIIIKIIGINKIFLSTSLIGVAEVITEYSSYRALYKILQHGTHVLV